MLFRSDETVTELVVELPGQRANVQVSRAELESLIDNRLDGVLSAFDDMLRRSRVRRRDLAAVAMAGGGAKIPLVAQRLSAHVKASVVTAVQPGLAMAVGGLMLSVRNPVERREEDELESTTMAAMVGASTGSFAASTGTFTASTDTLGASTGTFGVPTGAFFEDPSETIHQLAWSEADDSANEPVVYTGEPYDDDARVTPSQLFQLPKVDEPEESYRGNRLPQLVLGVAALLSMAAIGGVAFTLTSTTSHPPAPAPSSTSAVPAPPPPSSKPALPNLPSPSPVPPPPPSTAPAATVAPPVTSEAPPPPPPPPVTKTYQPPPRTYQPPPSTTQQATSTTSTTPPPTTTTSSTPTTTPSPTAATTTPTTSVPMTTEYLRLPFLPVPIPVQVPDGQGDRKSVV